MKPQTRRARQVALAQQRLGTNLACVEAAWARFIAEQMADPQPPM